MSLITLRELRSLRKSGGTTEGHGQSVGRIGHNGGKAAQLWDSEILKARRWRPRLEPPKWSASKTRRRARAGRDMRQLKPPKATAYSTLIPATLCLKVIDTFRSLNLVHSEVACRGLCDKALSV